MRKAYEKDTNRKKDVINKIVSYIDTNFGTIWIQDERIKEWHKTEWYEKAVQYWMMGGIIGKLKKLPTAILLAWFEITTRECSECGTILPVWSMPPGKGEFECTKCKQVSDRDLHSSIVMNRKATWKKVPLEWRNLKLLEITAQDILSLGSLTALIQYRRSYAL
jgi:transposase